MPRAGAGRRRPRRVPRQRRCTQTRAGPECGSGGRREVEYLRVWRGSAAAGRLSRQRQLADLGLERTGGKQHRLEVRTGEMFAGAADRREHDSLSPADFADRVQKRDTHNLRPKRYGSSARGGPEPESLLRKGDGSRSEPATKAIRDTLGR